MQQQNNEIYHHLMVLRLTTALTLLHGHLTNGELFHTPQLKNCVHKEQHIQQMMAL